ncbi:alpha-amylase family glycosyl hydrolase [Corynebacterium choanae]|uniref:1,4-alpha-glucan branching enzyme n=1 Tax=Corynebacterium choanae TaxID=1862358 RepID=A0A3G6J4B4_9CORY|nr:alpha-amylase family glycosyl hydrolase [Corynebacterium choanae]AZA12742.1 1,4-alpha-glucan branching enzyme GlgB [Corynebacterium choanae]
MNTQSQQPGKQPTTTQQQPSPSQTGARPLVQEQLAATDHLQPAAPKGDASQTPVVEGMGAIPLPDGGYAFRVWAPNATCVSVVGDFNNWNDTAHPLHSEGAGNFYGVVPEAATGDEYQFAIVNGDATFFRIDPRALKVTNSVGNGVLYNHADFDWEGDNFVCPGLHELVIYETHIGSFVDNGLDKPANIDDLAAKLDYLVNLGVNAIELMPLMEFAGDYSWGYNPANIFAVESSYGGPDALKHFIKHAHARGLAVIIDVVYNHFGPSDLSLWQFDGWSENDKGGIYFYQDWRSSTPWGDTRPDYGRREVRDFIADNARMWLSDYHADGLRLDMTPYMRKVDGFSGDIPDGWSMMSEIGWLVRENFPGKIVIAEDLHNDPAVTSAEAYGGNMHAQWDSQFVHPIREAITTSDDHARSVEAVSNAVTHQYHHSFDRVIYTESHDEVANGSARVTTEVDSANPDGWDAQKRATLGAALVLTSPGVPMLFQGQEFLEDEWFRDTVPLDWEQAWKFRDITRMFRNMISLRRNLDGTTPGLTGPVTRVLFSDAAAQVLVYSRETLDGNATVVAVNFARDPREVTVTMPYDATWKVRLNTDASTYSTVFGGHETFGFTGRTGQLSIGPFTATVLSAG